MKKIEDLEKDQIKRGQVDNKGRSKDVVCFTCQEKGHYSRDCPTKQYHNASWSHVQNRDRWNGYNQGRYNQGRTLRPQEPKNGNGQSLNC